MTISDKFGIFILLVCFIILSLGVIGHIGIFAYDFVSYEAAVPIQYETVRDIPCCSGRGVFE